MGPEDPRYLGPLRSFWHFTSHIDRAVLTSGIRLGLVGAAFVTEIRFSMSFTWWFISLRVLLGLDMLYLFFFSNNMLWVQLVMCLKTDCFPTLNLRFIHSSLLSLHCGRHWWHKKGSLTLTFFPFEDYTICCWSECNMLYGHFSAWGVRMELIWVWKHEQESDRGRAFETEGTEPRPCIMRVYLMWLDHRIRLGNWQETSAETFFRWPWLLWHWASAYSQCHMRFCIGFLICKIMGLPQLMRHALKGSQGLAR